jgi:hypothetical protein
VLPSLERRAPGLDMDTNSVITPTTLVFPKTRGKLGLKLVDLKACLQLSKQQEEEEGSRVVLAASIEVYLRYLLTHSAFKIQIPAFAQSEWHSPHLVKSLLSPTTRRHVVFVDRRGAVWGAVSQYLSPLSAMGGDDAAVSEVAWNLYMLVLATRYKGEVVVDPDRVIQGAAKIMRLASVSAEGRARLAQLIGLFRLFDAGCVVPSLRVRCSVGSREVTRRIDGILEDAYLLEASQLRRIFGLRQNEARTKRYLRRLLDFITRNRSWARGLLSLSSTTLISSDSGNRAMDILCSMLPALEGSMSQPVLVRVDANLNYKKEGCVRLVRGISGDWVFRFESTPTGKINTSKR